MAKFIIQVERAYTARHIGFVERNGDMAARLESALQLVKG